MRNTETVYLTHDNGSDLLLVADGVPLDDLSSITRVVIDMGHDQIDSDDLQGAEIWWNETTTYRGATVPVLRWKLGNRTGLSAGDYYGCKLITYDASNTNGIVWADDLTLVVN